jgi:hypothetical protein
MPSTQVSRTLRALAKLPVAQIDAEIASMENELAKLKMLRELLNQTQQDAGNGAPGNGSHGSLRDQVVSFLQGRHGVPMAAQEIATALGMIRGSVQSVLYQLRDKRVKRHKDGGWVAM